MYNSRNQEITEQKKTDRRPVNLGVIHSNPFGARLHPIKIQKQLFFLFMHFVIPTIQRVFVSRLSPPPSSLTNTTATNPQIPGKPYNYKNRPRKKTWMYTNTNGLTNSRRFNPRLSLFSKMTHLFYIAHEWSPKV